MVWDEVLTAFSLPEEKKSWLLKIANALWRGFKTDLQRYHMLDAKKNPITKRPEVYEQYITQEQWSEFITTRQSNEFKESSKKHQEMTKFRKYTYRGSRAGYAMIAENLKATKKVSKVTRADVWLAAHMKKKDKNFDQDVQDVVSKMDVLRDKESSGEIVLTQRHDLLSMTLEKEEHPGRIRGVGGDVTMTNYYGRSGRIKTSNGEVAIREAVKQIEAKMEAKYKEKYDAHVQKINKYIETLLHGKNANFPKFSFQSGKTEEAGQSIGLKESESNGHDSDNFVDLNVHAAASDNNEVDSDVGSQTDFRVDKEMSMPTHKSAEDYIPCRLFWPTKSQEVAKGKVFHTTKGVMLHNRKLKAGYVKVQVLTPIISSAELPLQTDEAGTVFEAVGSFVAWPAEFVTTTMDPSKEKVPLDPPHKVAENLKNIDRSDVKSANTHGSSEKNKVNPYDERIKNFEYYYMAMSNQMRELKLIEAIMGAKRTLIIGKINVGQLLTKKKLEANHISLYIRYMWDRECHKLDHMYGFLCPTSISPEGVHSCVTDRQKYIVKALKGNIEMKMFFAPYNKGGHWVLMVISVKDDTVYYLDPLHGEIDDVAKRLIEISLKVFWAQKAKNKPRQYTRWVNIKVLVNQIQWIVDTMCCDICGRLLPLETQIQFRKDITTRDNIHTPLRKSIKFV